MLLSQHQLEQLSKDRRLTEASRLAFRRAAFLPIARAVIASAHALAPIYDCEGFEVLPGTSVNPETSADPTVLRAHRFATDALVFLTDCFARDSYDDQGSPLISSVHFSRIYSNAYWNSVQMVYGDGDGLVILDFTLSPEFIVHEVFHGVTEHTCGLIYEGEPGALNESMSDVFGTMFTQWCNRETVNQASWMFGDELMGPTAIALGWRCVRNLADPAAADAMTRQPKHYSQYDSSGGPHENSGIPNHAFYTAAMAIGGHSWDRLGMIWYESLTSPHAHPRMSFSEFAAITVASAHRLFPTDTRIPLIVESAWSYVGVN